MLRGETPAHRLDLRRPKGRPLSGLQPSARVALWPGYLAELGFKAKQFLIAAVTLTLFHRYLCRNQGAVSPRAQEGDGDVELAGHGLQRLTAAGG